MIVIEIPPNANCETVEMRIFHDLGPPRPVSRVRLEREPGVSRWYEITGWTVAGSAQPALAQHVDDSGEGVALLIYGGDAGLRLRPSGSQAPWQLDQPEQWGLSFILTSDAADVEFTAPAQETS